MRTLNWAGRQELGDGVAIKSSRIFSCSRLVRLRFGTGDAVLAVVSLCTELRSAQGLCLHCLCATPVLCSVQCTAHALVFVVTVPGQHNGVAGRGGRFLRRDFVITRGFGKSRTQLQSRVKCTP